MTTDNEQNKGKIDFLKFAICHIENRIKLIDSKASILIAIEAAFLILATFAIKWFFSEIQNISSLTRWAIIILSLMNSATILLLVRAIKPTECWFSLKVELPPIEVEHNIFYPDNGFPKTAESYKRMIKQFNYPNDVFDNYGRTHFVLSHHLKAKYKYYNLAILFMKTTLILSTFAFIYALITKM